MTRPTTGERTKPATTRSYPYKVVRIKLDRYGNPTHDNNVQVMVDQDVMAGCSEQEWRKAMNRLAFRSDSRSNGLVAGSFEFRLLFDTPQPTGIKSKNLTRKVW